MLSSILIASYGEVYGKIMDVFYNEITGLEDFFSTSVTGDELFVIPITYYFYIFNRA